MTISNCDNADASLLDGSDSSTMKVSIVGAGFSGLSVAYHLTKCNNNANEKVFDIQILEARDRIGGRVYPFDLKAKQNHGSEPVIVDMGGQWIHEASKKNPFLDLLQEIDVPLLYAKNKQEKSKNKKLPKTGEEDDSTTGVRSGTYLSDGTRIPDPLFKKASRFFYKTFDQYNPKHITSQTSWQDLLDDSLHEYEKQQQQRQQRVSSNTNQPNDQQQTQHEIFRQILNYRSHRSECYEGGRMSELSVSLDELYQNLGGPDEIPEGGYNAVLEKVANFVGLDNIQLNCYVKAIEYCCRDDDNERKGDENNDQNRDTLPSGVGNVRIKYCRNDDEGQNNFLAETDCCVCTVPLGVLKKKLVEFDPPLPEPQTTAIERLGFGVLDKIMMLFDTKFWEDDFYVGIASEDPTKIQNFRDCSEDYDGQPVLAMLLGGDVARRFDLDTEERHQEDNQSLMTDDEIIEEAMVTLRTLFGDDVERPISYKVSRWLQDPYAYGSYSFAQIGSLEQDYDEICKPAGSNLFFAGEHTSKHHHSTVHGAWMTGKREADRIISIQKQHRGAKAPVK